MSLSKPNFELRSVRLREQHVKVKDGISIDSIVPSSDATPLVQGSHAKGNLSVGSFHNKSEDRKMWRYSFELLLATRLVGLEDLESGAIDSENYEGLLVITALVEVVYESEQHIDFKDMKAIDFDLDPIRDAWPFWRDLAQNSCLRVGFYPPIQIPVFPPAELKID